MTKYILTFETYGEEVDLMTADYFYISAMPEKDILGEEDRESFDIECQVIAFEEKKDD